jgi:hypothetical protein
LERYGVEQYSQTQQWKSVAPKTMSEIQTSEYGRARLNDPLWLTTEYVVNQRSVYDIADELDVHYCTVLQRIDLHNIPRQSYIYILLVNWRCRSSLVMNSVYQLKWTFLVICMASAT